MFYSNDSWQEIKPEQLPEWVRFFVHGEDQGQAIEVAYDVDEWAEEEPDFMRVIDDNKKVSYYQLTDDAKADRDARNTRLALETILETAEHAIKLGNTEEALNLLDFVQADINHLERTYLEPNTKKLRARLVVLTALAQQDEDQE